MDAANGRFPRNGISPGHEITAIQNKLYTGKPELNQAVNLIPVLVMATGPCSWHSHGFEVEGLFA